MKFFVKSKLLLMMALMTIVLAIGVVAYFKFIRPHLSQTNAEHPASVESAFVEEVYQNIADHYWQQISDEQLSNLFFLSLSRVYGTQPELLEKNLAGVSALVDKLIRTQPEKNHQLLLVQVVDIVLQNLQPMGRSRLYVEQDQETLNNTVANVDPTSDLFTTLDTNPGASDEQVKIAYENKLAQIEQTATNSAEQAQKQAQANRAYQAIGDQSVRERYAATKIEPTIGSRLLSADIFYLSLTKFSPTTVEDFATALQKISTSYQPQSLIIDLRGNVGGAIDGLPYFLGPFIGNNQYAYQFFSQGKTEDFKTKVGKLKELESFKRVVVLIDNNTQSSAEVMTAVFKKYHIGIVVGVTTRGWGTVERVFSLEHQLSDKTKHSVFLVHSLTLDENGQSIEGVGVKPDVDISQTGWQTRLLTYFSDPNLVDAVAKLVK